MPTKIINVIDTNKKCSRSFVLKRKTGFPFALFSLNRTFDKVLSL